MRDLNLPRGLERETVRDRDRDYTLRGSESRTLATVGAFRVVSSRDLRDHHDRPADPRSGDLREARPTWHAVAADCIHNRARLYHIHHRPLYHAIGQPDSRYRRTIPARSAAERLMRLDAALTSPNLDWLTTRSEKVLYLRARTAPESSEHATNATTPETPNVANQCPGTFPIGIDPSGHVVLLYIATVPSSDDFRAFLVGHAALLRVTPAWPLRLVFPQSLRRAFAAYQTVVHEELESPLHADTIYDLKRYFFHRRRGSSSAHYSLKAHW